MSENNKNLFTSIFRSNHWGSSESVSGPGSELRQTAAARDAFDEVVGTFGITSVLDVPCGDINWLPHTKTFSQLKSYIGMDIVEDLIEKNRKGFSSNGVKFTTGDITQSILPTKDLVLVRDCLVHLTSRDGIKAVNNIIRSESTYLLMTHYPAVESNVDTSGTHWRPLNMEKAPFNFPPPITFFSTDYTDNGQHYPGNGMGLWRISDLSVIQLSR